MLAQVLPDVFDWVQFGRVGQQDREGEVVGHLSLALVC